MFLKINDEVTIQSVKYLDQVIVSYFRLKGCQRDAVMKQNRINIRNQMPYSEYVRFYTILDEESMETWLGVSVSDIMHLTLNSRFSVSREVAKMKGVKQTKCPSLCSGLRKLSMIVSVDDMAQYIMNMNTRLPERPL